MNILITGAAGFIGRNLRTQLSQRRPGDNILCYDIGTDGLADFCKQADFVYHLAGVNRPEDPADFYRGNADFTNELVNLLNNGKKPPLLFASSVHAAADNPYGRSKKAAEDAVFAYGNAYVYRLPGIFGKWCRPNYNSVVATFCNNIANDLPVQINDANAIVNLAYIDDVCGCFLDALDNSVKNDGDFCVVEPVYAITLQELYDALTAFRGGRSDLFVPEMSDAFTRKLYSTYLSYVTDFSYGLMAHKDERGAFAEFLKSKTAGQVSVNITKPGFTKGNHWHHTKTEKFLTVSGRGVLRFRKVGDAQVFEVGVSGEELAVVDIPPGYTHSMTNTGQGDMITVIWADEVFDPKNPDTFYEDVLC